MKHSVWSVMWCFSQAVWTRWSTTRSAVTSGRWRLRCRGAAWRWSVRPWAPSYTCWPGFRGSAVWGTSWSITQRRTNGWFPVKSARFPSPAASSVWWTHAAPTKRTWIQHLHPRMEESSVAIWAYRWYKTTGSVGAENRLRHPLRYVHQITVWCEELVSLRLNWSDKTAFVFMSTSLPVYFDLRVLIDDLWVKISTVHSLETFAPLH